jgi:hypothetical protein
MSIFDSVTSAATGGAFGGSHGSDSVWGNGFVAQHLKPASEWLNPFQKGVSNTYGDNRDYAETAAAIALNYYYPGSLMFTRPLLSKGAQAELNTTGGQVAGVVSGVAGGTAGSGSSSVAGDGAAVGDTVTTADGAGTFAGTSGSVAGDGAAIGDTVNTVDGSGTYAGNSGSQAWAPSAGNAPYDTTGYDKAYNSSGGGDPALGTSGGMSNMDKYNLGMKALGLLQTKPAQQQSMQGGLLQQYQPQILINDQLGPSRLRMLMEKSNGQY